MKDGEKLTGAELEEAVREAERRLFSGPDPDDGPPEVSPEEIQEAADRLFDTPPAGRVPTGGGRS